MAEKREVDSAIAEAVKKYGQPADVGRRLEAWFASIEKGNSKTEDRENAAQRLDALFSIMELPDGEGE